MKHLILFFSFLLLISCESILKMKYGIKTPKYENERSIKKYLKKKGMDTTNVFVFKDVKSLSKASQMKLLNIPDITFFNEKGNQVEYKKSATECNAKANDFINDLNNFSSHPSNSQKTANDFTDLIVNNRRSEIKLTDINVFITWSIYTGKLNDLKAFDWVKSLEHAKKSGIKLNYYLVNCDLQKDWEIK